jgi:hypothetical protein
MKRLSEIKSPINELTAFQDPPTVLIMRRKGIRLFPNGQRVATYKNDNLDIELAIPYNPQTLGQHKISTIGTAITATEETLEEGEFGNLQKHHTAKGVFKKHGFTHMEQEKQNGAHVSWFRGGTTKKLDTVAKHLGLTKSGEGRDTEYRGEKHHISTNHEGETVLRTHTSANDKAGIDENTRPSDTLFGAYVHSSQLPGRPKAHHLLNHVESRYGEKAATHLKAAANHYAAGETELANHHYAKFKHQASLVGEEFMDEAYNPAAVEKAIKASKPKIGSKERIAIHRLLKGRHGDPTTHGPKEHPVSKPMKALLTGEETIVEATIHSLHSIAKSKTPATVRFKNGSNAMVHHGTAARIMRLHSLMREHNKRKVEALVNSSPDGLKKVVDFVDVHLK